MPKLKSCANLLIALVVACVPSQLVAQTARLAARAQQPAAQAQQQSAQTQPQTTQRRTAAYQRRQPGEPPTPADLLRGGYGPFRANNHLLFYHLDIRVAKPTQSNI